MKKSGNFVLMESKDLLTLCGGIIIAYVSYLTGKYKDRAETRSKLKVEYYKEFLIARNLILTSPKSERIITLQDHQRFSDITNSVMIVASPQVAKALQEFRVESSMSNKENTTREKQDVLYSQLIKEMRKDIGVSNRGLDDFIFYSWSN